jgi:hypothetical protein
MCVAQSAVRCSVMPAIYALTLKIFMTTFQRTSGYLVNFVIKSSKQNINSLYIRITVTEFIEPKLQLPPTNLCKVICVLNH